MSIKNICPYCNSEIKEVPGIPLTRKEREMFNLLFTRDRIILSRKELALLIFGKDTEQRRRNACSYLFLLKKKLKDTDWDVRTTAPYYLFRKSIGPTFEPPQSLTTKD